MQLLAGVDDCLPLIFLLNVHVERIKMDFEIGAAHRFGEFDGIFGDVHKIGLESVERFTGESYAVLPCEFGDFL